MTADVGTSAEHNRVAAAAITLALFAGRVFCEWATPLLAVALLDVLWSGPTWIADLTIREASAEAGGEIAVALALALVPAVAIASVWAIAGGLRITPTRASRVFASLSTASAAAALVIVLSAAGFRWLAVTGVPLPFAAKAVVVLGFLAALRVALRAEWRRWGTLERTSGRTRRLSRRSVLGLLPLSLGALWWGGVRWRAYWQPRPQSPMPASGAASPPNVLLVTFDALAVSDMSLYGYRLPTTPNIDRFARDGIVFDRFISASNFTTSSVTSILTGKTVSSHGRFLANYGRIPEVLADQNVAFELRRRGYTTAAIVANPYAHPTHLGLGDSFDYLPAPPLRYIDGADSLYHLTHSDLGLSFANATDGRLVSWGLQAGLIKYSGTNFPPDLAFDRALSFLAAERGPYFLWIHILAPHSPYDPPEPFLGRFLAGPEYANASVYGSSPLAAVVAWDGGSNFSHYRAVLQPEIDKFRLRYNEFIAYADDAFGRFIGKADALPNAAETVVMVSADHGENFAHGFWGHETSEMWQPTIHVPLAVRLPGKAAAGHRISGLAGHIDLMPTILDLAGAPVPSWCEGGSLLPIWRGGGGQQQRRRFAEMIDSPLRRPITSGGIAVLEGDDKFVLNIASGAGRLYDLATDPFEEHDLSRARPERAQVLRNAALARVERDPTAA